MGASVSMCAEHYVVRHISEEFTRLDKDNKGYLTLSHVMRDDSDACFRPPPRAEIDLKCIPSLYFLDQTKSGMFHKSDFMSLFQTCLAWQRTFRPDMEEKELVLDPAAFLTFKFCRDCEHLGTTHFAKWFCRLLAEGTPFTEHEGQLQLTRTHVLTLYKLLQIDKTTSTTADGLFLLLHETGSELGLPFQEDTVPLEAVEGFLQTFIQAHIQVMQDLGLDHANIGQNLDGLF
eukprot:c10556_g1_i1.p1 GENE.c10556_g1_i1~~c10556_g1_i1.p1  ORF type:complete len:232 (+),score=59.72 c10556_g1_i1:45-740(+)